MYLDVNILFLAIQRLDEAVTEETEESLLIIGDRLVELGPVLALETAAQAVQEETETETAGPDDLLQYGGGGLVRDHVDKVTSLLYQPLRDWSWPPPATEGTVGQPGCCLS